jgi:rare lipoprotein A
MPIFGLVWVASWVGCFFSSSQDLLKIPTYLPNLARSQNLNPANQAQRKARFSLAHIQNISAISAGNRFPSATIAQTSFPTNLHNQSQFTANAAVAQPSGWLGAVENLIPVPSLGRSGQTASRKGIPAFSTASENLIQPASERRTEKLSPVQNLFFRSWQRVATYTNPALSQVVVVKPKLAKVPPAENNANFKRRGFWHCSSSQQKKIAVDTAGQSGFQIWVRGCFVATVPTEAQAMTIAQNWQQLLQTPNLKFSQLEPTTVDGLPGGRLGKRLLFQIDPDLASNLNRDSESLAIEWVNNLRIALKQPPLTPTQAQERLRGLGETGEVLGGLASWYGPYFHGNLTANGEFFNQDDLTAAHPSLPFGTYLRVTNLDNGRSVIVRINDRGPYFEDRMLDLSREAARRLNGEGTGVFPVEAVVLVPEPTPVEPVPSEQRLARL